MLTPTYKFPAKKEVDVRGLELDPLAIADNFRYWNMTTPPSLPEPPRLSLSAADEYEFKFVGEGSANVVFEVIELSDNKNRDSVFRGAFHIVFYSQAAMKAS